MGTLCRQKSISVDSVYYDGTGRKYLRFNSVNPVFNEKLTFIEGIGSNFGIIYYWYDHLEAKNYLLCARKGDTTDYVNKYSGSCGMRLAVPEMLNGKVTCKVYPNPFDNKFSISFSKQQTESKVTIYTPEGKVVFDHNYKNATNIDVQIKLPASIYFLSIKSDDVIDTRKIIAQ
ncbi:MAG: T9SS type A sorting domain-containing protein [Flavipsychrobacter sp.]